MERDSCDARKDIPLLMKLSIITPSFNQLDWLRLCVASVADQVAGERDETGKLKLERVEVKSSTQVLQSSSHGFAVEHIIQDGGSAGIEEFAQEMAVMLQRKYGGESLSDLQQFELLHFRTPSGYTLRLFKEPDAGMYDAINRGIVKMRGECWAWLNCDEQYLPGTLPYVAQWFEKHLQADILCGDALLTDTEGRALSYRRIVAPRWHHTRLVHLASLSCASFYRRSVVTRGGGFDTRWRSIGDAEWMARLLKSGLKIEACGRLLSTFAFTGQNTSESPLASKEGVLWREAPDAPPEWMRKLVVLHHRLRKILAGAYQTKSVSFSIYRQGNAERVCQRVSGLSWNWPGIGKLKIDDSLLLSEGKNSAAVNKPLTGLKRLDGEAAPRGADGTGAPEVNQQLTSNNFLTLPILGSPLTVTSYAGLSEKVIEFVERGGGVLAVDFANTHVITLRRHEPEFAALTKSIDLIVPDGMPLVWLMNAKGAGLKDRVYGPSFTRKFLQHCPAGLTHYLVGGSEECGEKFRARMLVLNPTLQFVGGYHGRCSVEGLLEDDEAVLRDIQEKKPDFIWVGLGTPKQYAWMHRIKPQLDHGVLLAVGFAFDVNAGTKPDTPEWMQRMGLGWLHRMASEPRRLVGRYLKWNSLFLWYLSQDWLWGEGYGSKARERADARDQRSESRGHELVWHDRKFGVAKSQFDSLKLKILKLVMGVVDLLASDIKDDVTGLTLGRGLLLGFFGRLYLIGYEGRPLRPRFQVQKRLTYWKQTIGFTAQPVPDFPRLLDASVTKEAVSPKVMNILLTHQEGADFERVKQVWKPVCAEENLWVAFGGTEEAFAELDYPRKVWIDDPKLRTRDHQREKQSYEGIFRAMAPIVQLEQPDYVYLCEYDQLPLIDDLNVRQVQVIRQEGADVMGHWLYRIDETSHPHLLYHEADVQFSPFWASISKRENPSVILSMFGSGSFWTSEAFLAVAHQSQEIECYLEIYLPTLAHHLGFRVRPWNDSNHLISNLPSPAVNQEEAMKRGCWTVHPVKSLMERQEGC